MRVDLMTRNGLFGYVDDAGPDSEATARFLDTVSVPGGYMPDDGAPYLEALFAILRGGSYLWAQPATMAALERVEQREELLEGAAAAWDESKHRRYSRGTPVRGREGGGRFAPKEISAPETPGWFALGDPVTVEGEVYVVDDVKVLPTGNRVYTLRDSAGNLRKIASTHPGLSRFELPTPEPIPAPEPAPEPAAPNPDDELIEVTGRSLKVGDKFTDRYGTQYEVAESGSGLARYVRVRNLETGQVQIMRSSQKVQVRAGDHPAAARRLRKPPTRAVEGELGKVFSSTPAAKNPISVGANIASRELGNVIELPADVPKMPLKETRSQTVGSYFTHSTRILGLNPIGMSVNKGDQSDIDRMPSNIHHETGHYLDISVLGGAGRYASEARLPEVAGPVMDAIDGSQAVARINAMRDDPARKSRGETTYGIVMNAGDPYEKRYAPDYKHLSYLSSPTEKFARAFEQYVSTKNGARLDDYRRGAALPLDHYTYTGPSESRSQGIDPDSRAFYGWYWQPEDFAPISAAFDEMFGRLGWSRK